MLLLSSTIIKQEHVVWVKSIEVVMTQTAADCGAPLPALQMPPKAAALRDWLVLSHFLF